MPDITDYFLPDALSADDGIERRRAEIAIKTAYILVPWGLVASAFVAWLIGSAAVGLVIAVGPLVMALAPWILRCTGSMRLASFFILLPMFVVFAGWSLATGGVIAPGVSWLLLCPLLALIFRGTRTAVIWMVVVVASWGAIFAAGYAGIIPPVDVTTERFQVRRMVELLGLGTTVFGLFFLKDSLQQWLICALRTREADTRAIIDTAPDGIVTVDLEGTVHNANRAAVQLFGLDRRELIGADIESLVETLTADHLAGDTDAMTRFGATEHHRARCGDDLFPVEIAFGLLDGADDQTPRVVMVLRDITEQKKTQSELRRARDDALAANRAKNRFLANMSHELRTPLNAVIGYSEMLIEEIDFLQDNDEPGADGVAHFLPDLRRIQTAGQHLLSIVTDILNLANIESGEVTVRSEQFELQPVIDDIASTIGPLADKNDNTVRVDVPDDLEPLYSDKAKIRQVLFNLMSNGCKFTKQGQVRLEVRVDDHDGDIVFTVEDTGIGMDDDQLQEVFDAFRQADDSTTRQFEGAGLGLTVASHFITLLGGDIDVESTPGEGTTFTVRLPRNRRLFAPSSGDDSSEAADAADTDDSKRDTDPILVVDDDPDARDLLCEMLQREGFDVLSASTGAEGLKLARQHNPAAITLDVMMPETDGWMMLSRLREDAELADIPVIIVSMLAEQSRGYALGTDHYLVKPVRRDQLVELLEPYRNGDDHPGTILVVEDDAPSRALFARILTDDGWQVAEATDGAEALDAIDQTSPDLVILDLMMPNMNGFQFLERFRKQRRHRNTPVVVVTAKKLTADDMQQLNGAVEEIVTKAGLDYDELLDRVRDMVIDNIES